MTDTNTQAQRVRLSHTVPATPERVYRAWLDPELMVRWFAPVQFRVAHAEVDERTGGALRVWHSDDVGTDLGGVEAVIAELIPAKRIVLRFQFVGPDRTIDPGLESRLTVTFSPTPDGHTALELTHDQLDGLHTSSPEVADSVRDGWAGTLNLLAAVYDTP